MNSKSVLSDLDYTIEVDKNRIYFKPELNIQHSQILLIVNLTFNNTMMYNFAVPAEGGTYANNILTLKKSITGTGMANSNKLMIVIATENKVETLLDRLVRAVENNNELLEEFLKKF